MYNVIQDLAQQTTSTALILPLKKRTEKKKKEKESLTSPLLSSVLN